MDPDTCLEEIRKLIRAYNTGESTDFHGLIERIEALDNWIIGGGFLPAEWKLPTLAELCR